MLPLPLEDTPVWGRGLQAERLLHWYPSDCRNPHEWVAQEGKEGVGVSSALSNKWISKIGSGREQRLSVLFRACDHISHALLSQ